ncbi:MAG TPA: hypothetical protein VF385_03685 [Patescibacteria group bacterium]
MSKFIIAGGIIATVGAILGLGLELKVGLHVTVFGAIIVIVVFVIDEWRMWKGKEEKDD